MRENPVDYGRQAQAAAEKHLSDCMAWLDYEENVAEMETAIHAVEDLPEGLVADPASAPFDGCDTCVVREVLFAAWSFIETSLKLPRS